MYNLTHYLKLYFFAVIILFLSNSCVKKEFYKPPATQNDGLYDSLFPHRNDYKELEDIEKTVELVYSQTHYKSYIFARNRKLNPERISQSLLEIADEVKTLQKTVFGTATIIYNHNNRIGLMSCAHIFDKPDTIISYYQDEGTRNEQFLASIEIKQKQTNFAQAKSRIGTLEVILSDLDDDIAILTNRDVPLIPLTWSKTLDYPFGKAKDLKWGTFVYIFGYPSGYKVLTKAIVSSPDRDKKGSFIVDSFFNKGLSGGLVLALRDGTPNFEIAGMLRSSAGDEEAVLIPDADQTLREGQVYEGKPVVHYQSNIKYGVTFAVSSESIIELIKKNQEYLMKRGLDFGPVIKRAEQITTKND